LRAPKNFKAQVDSSELRAVTEDALYQRSRNIPVGFLGMDGQVGEIEDKPERELRGLADFKDDALKQSACDPLRCYLYEISKFSPLSREEEHELAIHHHKTGDRGAAIRLITSNLKLVVKIAMLYKKGNVNLVDPLYARSENASYGLRIIERVSEYSPSLQIPIVVSDGESERFSLGIRQAA
jgi:DNA-directed RNA polymerase sigma subunit (sigma70/sigma32)